VKVRSSLKVGWLEGITPTGISTSAGIADEAIKEQPTKSEDQDFEVVFAHLNFDGARFI
jgi:hypothetical protein